MGIGVGVTVLPSMVRMPNPGCQLASPFMYLNPDQLKFKMQPTSNPQSIRWIFDPTMWDVGTSPSRCVCPITVLAPMRALKLAAVMPDLDDWVPSSPCIR